jgi:predicted site-specific integrase-resolvase
MAVQAVLPSPSRDSMPRCFDRRCRPGPRAPELPRPLSSRGMGKEERCLLQDRLEDVVKNIVVEHKDRLVRFGFEYLEALMQSSGRRIIVVDEAEMKDDLVQDMIDVLTSFCARLYGRRSARRRARKALKEIETD